ncbi:hypothetical protein [Pontibacter liquoris]|uniref:hypothetical protein n=1 Tax=Pontibacter liquoris TaxID=2905677 RepID=UPI001FA6EAB2|nr:hypothetical protein [Pontibacter liquoris]
MKKTVIFLLAALLLAATMPVTTQAQKSKSFTLKNAMSLFNRMYGTRMVKTLIWQPEQQRFFETSGTVRYSLHQNKALREEFDIEQPDGSVKHVEGMLRYDTNKSRFEFVQYDTEGHATVMFAGKWDPDFAMIDLEPLKRQWQLNGKRRKQDQELHLRYFFFPDGSFKKVVRTLEDTGDSAIAYEYHCLQQKIAGL